MPSCCVVPGCSKRGGFRFPSDENTCLKWRTVLKREGMNGSLWKPSRSSVVCDQHFTPDDYKKIRQSFVEIGGGSNRRLKQGAVPSIFPWSEERKVGDEDSRLYRIKKRHRLLHIALKKDIKTSDAGRITLDPNRYLDVVLEEEQSETVKKGLSSPNKSKESKSDPLIIKDECIQTNSTRKDLSRPHFSKDSSVNDSSVLGDMDIPTLLHGGSTFIYDYIKWHIDAPEDFTIEIVDDDELVEDGIEVLSQKISKKSEKKSRGPEPKFVSSSPEYFCSICNRAFTTQFAHKRHNAVQHGVIAKDKAHFKCVECLKIFFCNDELNRHMIKAHNCPNTVIYRCELCSRLFPSKYELARHKVKIHEPRTIPCTYCNEKFSRHFLMRDHMKRMHTRSLEAKCKTCNEMVPLSDMENHMITEHSTTWKCLVCGQVFLKQSLMIQHELEQHSS